MRRFRTGSTATPCLLVLVFFAISLVGCSDGNGGAGGNAATSVMVGPMGGQVTSSDGRLTLDIPAGALTMVETITVTPLTLGQLDPVLAAAGPSAAYRLEPDGLQFALPIAVSLDGGAPPPTAAGTASTGIMDLVVQSSAGLEAITSAITVDVPSQTTTVSGTLDHFSDLAVFTVTTEDLVFTVEFPEVLSGGSGTLTGEVNQSATSTVSSSAIQWRASATSALVTSIDQTSIFDPGGLNPVMAQTLTNTATLTCQTPGLKNFQVEFTIQVFDIGALLPGLTRMESPSVVFVDLETTCPPPTGGGQPTLLSVQGISSIEAINVVASTTGCGVTPALLVAGLGGANLIDPGTGTILETFTPPGAGAFFDALYFPRPTGQPDNGLFLSGQDITMLRLNDQCQTGGFAQTSLNSNLDATYAAGDPTMGGHAAGPGILTEIVFSTPSQGWVFQDSGIPQNLLPPGFRSVQGNAAGDRFLALGDSQLVFIDDSGPTPTAATAFSLGQNPRRVRWDPASGFGAISDLADDTVTVFTWDGVNPPTLTDIVSVGSGPVGVDVMGNRIASAGFNDATYTIIELDMNGMATTVTINPSPFIAGGQNPGHALFLRDVNNTIVMSFNGDDVIGVIPNGF